MIITQKKPMEELMAMVGDAKTVAIVGCNSCATACHTGGEPEVAALAKAANEGEKTETVVKKYKKQLAKEDEAAKAAAEAAEKKAKENEAKKQAGLKKKAEEDKKKQVTK